jgi:methionyl-tRNA formyltransferase
MLRVIFMGTPDFAVSALRTLAESGNEIVCVLTQPDRPKGRGYETLPSPVRVCAESAGIRVCTPQTLKDAETQDFLRSLSPDLILVAAYGKILPSEILTMPRLGCVNLHASLLPAWRGAAPIQRAVMNGERETEVCLMEMAMRMDSGRVFARIPVRIGDDMTASGLFEALKPAVRELIHTALPLVLDGTLSGEEQDESRVVLARNIAREEEKVSFREEAMPSLYNHIRGLIDDPMPYGILDGKRIKFCRVSKTDEISSEPAGTILGFTKDAMKIAAAGGTLLVYELQPEGKQRMKASDYYNGAGRAALGKQFE